MSEPARQPNDPDPSKDKDRPDSVTHQQVQVPGVTARVPASIGHGVVSTGVIVMNGPHAFVLDFLQQMGVPTHLVSRVVLPHGVVPRLIQALEQNLANYQQKFGPPMQLPRVNPSAARPTVEEIYDNIKIPDEQLSGNFAEGIMIRHSAAEFCFDFVTQFFPHASVSSRVFMSAPHVPPLLEALKNNYQKFLETVARQPPPNPPSGPKKPEDEPPAKPPLS